MESDSGGGCCRRPVRMCNSRQHTHGPLDIRESTLPAALGRYASLTEAASSALQEDPGPHVGWGPPCAVSAASGAHAVHKLRTPRTPLHWQPMGAPLWRTCHKDKGGEAGSSAKPASLIKHGKNTPTDLLRRTHSVPDNRHKQRDRQTRTATGSAGPGCVMCGGSVCN